MYNSIVSIPDHYLCFYFMIPLALFEGRCVVMRFFFFFFFFFLFCFVLLFLSKMGKNSILGRKKI